MTVARLKYGDDFLKRLLIDQKLAWSRDGRQITEAIVRETHPVAIEVTPPILAEFQAQGLGKNVVPLKLNEPQGVAPSNGGIWLFNRAPHPNAAKVFINWILSKEGGEAWSQAAKENSRRADVAPYDPDTLPDVTKPLYWASQEDNAQKENDTRKVMEKLVLAG